MKYYNYNEYLSTGTHLSEKQIGSPKGGKQQEPADVVADLLTTMRSRLGFTHQHSQQKRDLHQLVQNLRSSESAVRVQAVRTLGSQEEQLPLTELVDRLLNDESMDVRAAVARVFGAHHEGAAKTALLLAFGDPAWNVRAAAIEALGRLEDPSLLPTFLSALQTDYDRTVRLAAVWALDQLGSHASAECFAEAVQDEDEMVYAAGVEAIERRGGATRLQILQHMANNEDEMLQNAAIQTLSVLGKQIISHALIPALKSGDVEVRSRAIAVCCALGTYSPLQPLIRMLESKDEMLQAKAIEALSLFSQSPSLQQGEKLEDPAIREAALDALVFFGAKGSLQPLFEALKMDERMIWSSVAEALTKLYEQMPERTCLEFLLCALKDTDEMVRMTATEILREFVHQQDSKRAHRHLKPETTKTDQKSTSAQRRSKEWARNSLLLQLFTRFLEEKRGNFYDTLLGSAPKQVRVLFCTYKSEGNSMQEAILSSLEDSTPIHHLDAALRDEDEVLRFVASQMREKLKEGRWQEMLLISIKLPQLGNKHRQNEDPMQIVFCGLGCRHMSDLDLGVIKPFAFSADQRSHQYGREDTMKHLSMACNKQWRRSLCERAHEMTGLKLFYEANEELPATLSHPWLINQSDSVSSDNYYS